VVFVWFYFDLIDIIFWTYYVLDKYLISPRKIENKKDGIKNYEFHQKKEIREEWKKKSLTICNI